MVVFAIFGLLSIAVWFGLSKQERLQAGHEITTQANAISHEIRLRLWERINALERMARRMEQSVYLSDQQWLSDAELNVMHDPSYYALLWVGADREVRQRALYAVGKEADGGMALQWQPQAVGQKAMNVSHGFSLVDDVMAVQIAVPISNGQYQEDFVVGVFRLNALLRDIAAHARREGYSLSIHDGRRGIYGSQVLPEQQLEQLREVEVQLPGVVWNILVTLHANSRIDRGGGLKVIILVGGMAMALLLAWATHLYLSMHQQATAVRAANENLQQEITERRQAQEALAASETKYRTLFGDSSDAIMLLDHMTLIDCNDATLRLFGCDSKAQFLDRRWSEFLPALQPDGSDSAEMVEERMMAAFKLGRSQFECMHRGLAGQGFPAHVLLSAMQLNGKDILLATVRNITDQRKVLDRERKLLEQNRFLIRKLMRSQEDERSYIARELHDELGQSLTAIDTMATLIESQAPDGKIAESAGKISDIVANLFEHVRGILNRIRSPVLESTGLVEAIRELLDHHRQVNGLNSALSVSGEFHDLSATAITALYRVMQEALTNIVRHAKAAQVDVRMRLEDGVLFLDIEDNGRGADLDRADNMGLGMIGMRERIEALNGGCTFDTSPGSGMRVSIALPMVEGNIREQAYG